MICVTNVGKEYRLKNKETVKVLEDVSFTIDKGEVAALLGHNGSGKSTLIKCMCGVIKPTNGNVWINDKEAFKNRKELIKKMGVVFNQKPSFIVDLSVWDNLLFFQAIYQIPDKMFMENIDFLNQYLHFKDLLQRPYRKLSFGERVKCEIVSVLLHNPEYIYLDEPTIGLDYTAKKGLYELLKILKERGCTILITTHEVDYIENICDKVIILSQGKVRYEGKPGRILNACDAKCKVHVKYSSVIDKKKAESLACISIAGKPEDGEINFVVEDEKQKQLLLKELIQAYDVMSVGVEMMTIREVLESVLKEVGQAAESSGNV